MTTHKSVPSARTRSYLLPAADGLIPDAAMAAAAYDRVRDEILAIPSEQLLPAKLDVGAASLTVLGALPRIIPYADSLKALDGMPARSIDNLHVYAQAAFTANNDWIIAGASADELQRLGALATPLRTKLFAVAEMLTGFGLCDVEFINAIRPGSGYRDTADDLKALERRLRALWPQIDGKVMITLADLDQAQAVSAELAVALGARDQGTSPALRHASEMRQRAFTLLARAYDDVRRGLHYRRWTQGDADTIAPSLYAHYGSSSPKDPTPGTDGATVPATPATPVSGVPQSAPDANPGPSEKPFTS